MTAVWEQFVEAAARAYYEWATLNEGEDSRWDEDSPSGEQARRFARVRAEVMLRAVLAVEPDCETCEGTYTHPTDSFRSCPAGCDHGKVKVRMALVEQVGWRHTLSGGFAPLHWAPTDPATDSPVFRALPVPEETT